MSCNSDNINLDNKSLFKYVMELDEISKDINDVGPRNPMNFGDMVEPFKADKKQKNNNYNHLFWICVILLIVFAGALLLGGACSKSSQNSWDLGNDLPVYEYRRPMYATFTQ
jgi:hypothetical protein